VNRKNLSQPAAQILPQLARSYQDFIDVRSSSFSLQPEG